MYFTITIFYCIFDQINVALVRITNFFKKIKNLNLKLLKKLKAKCIQIAHDTVTLDTVPHYTGQLATSLIHKL